MKAWDIVAYLYRAELVCEHCADSAQSGPFAYGDLPRVEDRLNACASARGIDRMDERTFDSDEFPKMVFASDVDDNERCSVCGGEF